MTSLFQGLTYKNALNCVAVLIHILASIDYGGPGGMEWLNSVREFGKFETIVTPTDATFYLRYIILYFNVTFGIVQMLPKYSSGEIVQEGVSHWFFAATIAQVASSIFFSFDSLMGFFLSTIVVGAMVFFLCKILCNQASGSVDETQHSPEEYWLLRFPFSLQTGWYMCIFITSVNNIFVRLGYSPLFQVFLAIICFASFAGIAAKMLLYNGNNPNYVIPAVISVFTFGIAFDFQGPGIEDNFGGGVLIMLITIVTIVSIGIAVGTGFLLYTNELKGDDDESADAEYAGAEMTSSNNESAKMDAAVAV